MDKLPEYNRIEILLVEQLGKRIGYGRMMQIATGLWRYALIHEHDLPPTGAFVSQIYLNIKKNAWKKQQKELEMEDQEIATYYSGAAER